MSKIKESNTRKKTIGNNIIGLIKHHNINVFIKDTNDEYIEVTIDKLRCDDMGDLIIDFLDR